MKAIILSMTILIGAVSQAKQAAISVDIYSYPSPAAVHLDIVQHALAEEAVKACGNQEAVIGLSDINISLKGGDGSEEPFAKIVKENGQFGNLSLQLWYPKIVVFATVHCK